MTPDLLSLTGAGIAALVVVAFAAWCVHTLRHAMPRRIARLEEALRVYNTANASLGREVAELEVAVRQLRAQLESQQATASPARAPGADARAPVAEPRPATPSAAERYGIAAPVAAAARAPAPEAGFSEAELRLAQLIKSRLATLRLN